MQQATHFATPGMNATWPGAPLGGPTGLVLLLTDALDHLAPSQAAAREKIAEAIHLAGGAPKSLVSAGGFSPWQAKRVRAHIETNLDSRLRLDDAAAVVRVSKSHFSRTFKKTFGQPFAKYVTALRLEHARTLLASTDQQISEVALACGLTDQSHLTRLFHRRYGAPPHAWRRVHGRSSTTVQPGSPA
jgi:AraC-like DNA-binding protein